MVDAMEGSRDLLLLASREAASSKWVERELAQWLSKNRGEQLLLLLTDGELAWDDNSQDFDWQRTTTAPPRALAGGPPAAHE
jgi:MTH538 TIR-like domain (DUF1863)